MAGLYIYHTTNNFELIFWIALIVAGIGLALAQSINAP